MNSSLFCLLMLSVFSLTHIATSLCAPRSYPYNQVLRSFLPPSIAKYAPASSPIPSPINLIPPTLPLQNPSTLSSNANDFAFDAMKSVQNPSTSSNVDDFASNAMKSLHTAIFGASGNTICKQTDYPDICNSAIQSITTDPAKTDPRTILKFTIKGAMVVTRVAMDVASVLVNKPNIDKTMRSIIGVCTDGFEDAINDLQEAVKALDANDTGTMNSMLSALFSDYGGCGDAFTDANMNSPLKAYEELLYKHASNCMTLGTMI